MRNLLRNSSEIIVPGMIGGILLVGIVARYAVRGDDQAVRIVRTSVIIAVAVVVVTALAIFLALVWFANQDPPWAAVGVLQP